MRFRGVGSRLRIFGSCLYIRGSCPGAGSTPGEPESAEESKNRQEPQRTREISKIFHTFIVPSRKALVPKKTVASASRRLFRRLKRTLGQQPATETLRRYCWEGCFDASDVKAKSAVVVSSEMSCVSIDFVLYSGGRLSSRMSSSGLSSTSS